MKTAQKEQKSPADLKAMATAVRALAIDMVEAAQSGHPGAPLGLADVATVLWANHLKFDAATPNWPERDRFILSNGHASALHYALLHLTGYDVTLDDLRAFRQLDSKTPGHPEYGHTPGIETTTGPLGQGFANAVGMALALKREAARTGTPTPKVYVVVGDGCLMEGISHEAAELAVHWKLDNLVVLFDDNGITIDGSTDLALSTNQVNRFATYGFLTRRVDGHDYKAINDALSAVQNLDAPSFIACKTTIGFGSPNKAGTNASHGSPLGLEEAAATKKALGCKWGPFKIKEPLYDLWRSCDFDAEAEEAASAHTEAAIKALQKLKKKEAEPVALATRAASGQCVPVIAAAMPEFISGSADLSGSNNTATGGSPLSADNLSGNYIHYGVREMAMGAIMNGLCLGGLRAASGTFLAFTDYMKAPIRLAALMKLPSIFVMTHDSIGVGEDGPTHQPVEHLATLRATPGLEVWRPADLIETIESWQSILATTDKPAVLALSRQKIAPVRTNKEANRSEAGGYILYDSGEFEELRGIFLATGSEVHLARQAQDALAAQGVATRVVSLPCVERFVAQPADYQREVLPPELTCRVIVEAGTSFGWQRFAAVPSDTRYITVDEFGRSAPGVDVFNALGITADAAQSAMQELLEKNYENRD